MQGKKNSKGEDSPGLYRNSGLPSWRWQEAAAQHSSNRDSSWAGDKFPVLRHHPTAGEVLCCKALKSRRWCPGEEFVMAGAAPHARHSQTPQDQQVSLQGRAWSCLSLLPVQVRQRDPCLKAQEDSWEHGLAKGNGRTATTRWLMALIWTLLTAQSPGTSAETD